MRLPHERWEKLGDLFDAARALPADQRAPFLDEVCPDDELRQAVDDLLRADALLESGTHEAFLRLDARRAAVLLNETDTDAATIDEFAAGTTLGRYRIVRPLGQGGMGVVYLAEDQRLHRRVALKLLPRHLNVDAAARRRFEDEARAASTLDHPNIVTVYDIGDAPGGRVFIAMAFCDGSTLRDVVERGPLPVAQAVTLACQIADGLAAAHRRGIVHRDIKPRNIIVSADGVARIVDFGIAKMAGSAVTQTEVTPGTVAYMSPEQTRSGSTDMRADVWAFGIVLYEMLAARRPFEADSEQAVIYAIRNDEPQPITALRPDVPPELGRVVERCLRKDPAARYPDAGALLCDLRALSTETAAALQTEPRTVVFSRGNAAARPTARVTRQRIIMAAALVLLIAALTLGVRASARQPLLETRRVAVAAVENRTGTVQRDELASMATDWIAHGLWQTGFIEVVPLAAFDTDQDGGSARTLAERAGARLLVAAALYGADEGVRLQAQIIDVFDGRLVESIEPVGAPTAALLDGVDELRHRIQAALYPRLDTQLTHIQAVQRPPRFEAYRAYLAGRQAHGARNLPDALRHFQQAAALDSAFMLPHVLSAVVMNMMGDHAATDSITRALERQRDRLDPFSRAHVDWLRGTLAGDRHASHAGMREAARLAPGSTLVNYQLADETVRLGRPQEAIDLLYSIEPERGELRGWFGYWQVLAGALHLRSDFRRELREVQRARLQYSDDPRAIMLELRALAALGRTGHIERLIDDLVARPVNAEPSPGAIMLNTALELRVHAPRLRPNSRRAAADRLLDRAITWYRNRPAAQQSVRARHEHTIALAAAGRRAEARQLLEELATSPDHRLPGPSPFAPNRTPNYPDAVAYHGALGVLAALDGNAAATATALAGLDHARGPYDRGRSTYWRAAILAAQGQLEPAMALLRQAFDEGVEYSTAVHTAPELESLRAYAPFQAFMRPQH